MKPAILKIAALLFIAAALIGAFILYNYVRAAGAEKLEVYFFDFADEDSILIRHKGYNILIDAAEEKHAPDVAQYLRELGISRLDALILTHPDKDHIGGAAYIIEQFEVSRVYRSAYEKGSSHEKRLLGAIAAANLPDIIPENPEKLTFGRLTVDIYPPGEAGSVSSNDASLIIALRHGEISMVMPGDAEAARLEEMLLLDIFPCDLYKVPHHGRDGDLSAAAIERLKPKYAVITAKEAGETVLSALSGEGTRVFYTSGRLVLAASDGKSLSVKYLDRIN